MLVHVTNLTKRYGALTALDGVSFSIRSHEVLGLIGPNGSGKTTLFECLGGGGRSRRERSRHGWTPPVSR